MSQSYGEGGTAAPRKTHRQHRATRRRTDAHPRATSSPKLTPPCRECRYPLLPGERTCPRCGASVAL